MDLERSLPAALDGLVPEPPTTLLPGEVEGKARKRVRRQRVLAAAGTAAVVALASVAVANFETRGGDRPGPAGTPSGEPSATPIAFPVTRTSVDLTASGQLGPEWARDAVIRYGSRADEVSADTFDTACPPACGPDSAAPGPDGTWWVLDPGKQRVAQFGVDGELASAVAIPVALEGRGTSVREVRVLDDGTVVIDDSGRLLHVKDGTVAVVPLDEFPGRPSFVVSDDGRQVYTDHGVIQAVDFTADPPLTSNGPLRLRDGTPYSISGTRTEIVVDWLEEGTDQTARQSRLDLGESFSFTWAAEQRGVVFLISGSNRRARIVHLGVDGTVTTESAPAPHPMRMGGLPTLRTNSLGWIGLALAEEDGLYLYHRLSPGAVALNGHTCTSPTPPTTDDAGRPIAKLEAELDGDGRPDQVVSYQARTGQYVYQAVLADGRVTDPQNQLDVFPSGDGIGTELLGAHDFDGDGRAEVLLRSGGNTADAGGIAHLQGCQLVALRDGTRDLDFTYLYGAHSNCCPDTRVLVTCDGSHLIETTSQPDVTAEKYATLTEAQVKRLSRTWERNVYQVDADSAHRISHTTGRTGPGEDVIPARQTGVRC